MEKEDGKPAAQPTATIDPAVLATAKSEGAKAGAEAERARVKGITQHAEAAGRTKLAEHLAYSTALSVEDAAGMLAAAPKEVAEAANPLAAAMPPNPQIGADKDDPAKATGAVVNSTAIFQSRANQRLAVINGGK